MCLSLACDSSTIATAIIIKLDTVTAADMRMHQVLIILTTIFMQGHTDLNGENTIVDYFRNCSSIAHPVRCEDSPTKCVYIMLLVR